MSAKKINDIKLVDKSVSKEKAYSSKISIFNSPFSKQKKAPIWELFFVCQHLRTQHFLHSITMINMDNFNYFNYKKNDKNNNLSLTDTQYRQLP